MCDLTKEACLNQAELLIWERVQNFSIDSPDAKLSFSDRLARENHWSLAYSIRVIDEYKKFMFLAVTSGHVVTPSDQVDQAWHLHMVYTRSYWQDFCGNILQQEIHHGPTQGGASERVKFENLYERTKETYFKKFGVNPPTDIWPSTEERFSSHQHRRIDLKNYWVIPRPRFDAIFRYENLIWFPAVGLPMGLIAWTPFDLDGPSFLVFYFLLTLLAAVTIGFIFRLSKSISLSPKRCDSSGNRLSANHWAFLGGGEKRVMQSAVCELLVAGYAETLRQELKLQKDAPASGQVAQLSAVAQTVLGVLQKQGGIRHDKIRTACRIPVARIRGQLMEQGLVISRITRIAVIWLMVSAMSSILIVGGMRIAQALDHQKPFGFLLIEMALVVLTGFVLSWLLPHRTLAGDELLKKQQAKLNDYVKKLGSQSQQDHLEIATCVGVMGTSALAGTAWYGFQKEIEHVVSPVISGSSTGGDAAGTTGCGSGCGGGGCGGGCGGCGG